MSLGRRIVQRATTRVFRRGIKVIVRKQDDAADTSTASDAKKKTETAPATDGSVVAQP